MTTDSALSGYGHPDVKRLRSKREVLEGVLDQTHSEGTFTLQDFEIAKQLGKGHSGKVYLARFKKENYLIVLKCVKKEQLVAEGGEHLIRREIQIMQNLRHPNILRLYGWFHDSDRVYLMLELASGGEVYNHLRKVGRFSEKRSSRYIRQVAAGLEYLHSKNVIHRDLKPENLLLGDDDCIKICDFGWSVHTGGSQLTLAGTSSYLAPEQVIGRPYGKEVDIWALGVLTYEFVTGQEPFNDEGLGPRHQQNRICRVDVRFEPFVSDEARNFMTQLLRFLPSDRLPLASIPAHLWIQKHSLS